MVLEGVAAVVVAVGALQPRHLIAPVRFPVQALAPPEAEAVEHWPPLLLLPLPLVLVLWPMLRQASAQPREGGL